MSTNQSTNQNTADMLTKGINNVKSLFHTNSPVQSDTLVMNGTASNAKTDQETYHAWGVNLCGKANANQIALEPALQLCYSQNVKDQQNNQAIQQQAQQNIKKQINIKEGDRDGKKIHRHRRMMRPN